MVEILEIEDDPERDIVIFSVYPPLIFITFIYLTAQRTFEKLIP